MQGAYVLGANGLTLNGLRCVCESKSRNHHQSPEHHGFKNILINRQLQLQQIIEQNQEVTQTELASQIAIPISSFLFDFSITQLDSWHLQLKEMFKGIKKTKQPSEQPEANAVRSSMNEHKLKNEVIMAEEQQQRPIIHKQVNVEDIINEGLKKYQECYDLFLGGKQQLLESALQELSKLRKQRTVKTNVQKQVNKFEYNLDFDQDKDKSDKQQLKKRNKPIMASNRVNEHCVYCPDHEQLQLLSASNYVYLALPKCKTFTQHYHFILAPVDHQQTMIGLNQDILTEIINYKKCLIQAFDKMGLQAIFFQQFSRSNSHIYIQCLAISHHKAQDLPFFFKQTLQGIEGDWSTHKSIIKIQKQKGGIQKQIPKQIKYFYIDFSTGHGFAHVIQNQRFWKRQFCYQVLATALGMELHQVKTTQEYTEEEIVIKRQNFQKIWKAFDWTQLI